MSGPDDVGGPDGLNGLGGLNGVDAGRGNDSGGGDERFVAFLRREAASYHEPPGAPREEMWPGIEAAWRTASLAAGYHEPPETPREEMWPRIEAAWRLRSSAPETARGAGWDDGEPLPAGPRVARGRAPDVAGAPRRWRAVPWGWAVGIAAALLAGIVIGRGVPNFGGGPAGPELAAGEGPAAESPAPAARRPGGASATERDPEQRAAPGTGEAVAGGEARPRETPAGETALAETAPGAPDPGVAHGGGEPAGTAPAAGDASLPYRLATAEYLGRVETLLASFRDRGGMSEDDRQVAAWAGELLSETRLLLDWPADRDPRMRALLEELELVLAQMARLDQGDAAAERAWIADGLERRDVLPRVRAVAPVGMPASNIQGI